MWDNWLGLHNGLKYNSNFWILGATLAWTTYLKIFLWYVWMTRTVIRMIQYELKNIFLLNQQILHIVIWYKIHNFKILYFHGCIRFTYYL